MSTRSAHSEVINPAIACIYDQALTSIVGTGFTLTERHVVTCAHVVNAALGRDHVTTVPPTEQTLLTLSFLNSRHTELHRELVAKVVKWIPQERGFFDLDDIAILELIDTPKPLAIPKLVQLTEHDYFSQRPFQAFGFNISEGSWADGRIGGLTATDTIQLNMERPIEEGFSGAPVWDKNERGVIGMLITIRPHLETAYMIPLSRLLQIFPEVDQITTPRNPVRSWVWHSTDESIAAEQISVLSVLETFCALGLYGWLAFHFEHQWWLLISAVSTPVILLRSSQAKILGIKLLRQYWQEKDIKVGVSKLAKAIIISIMIINLFIAYYLSYSSLPTDNLWTFFGYLFVFLMYLIPSMLIGITVWSSQFIEINNLLFRISVYTVKLTFSEPLQKSILIEFLKSLAYTLVFFSVFYATNVLFEDIINEFLKKAVAIIALLVFMYANIIASRIIGGIIGIIFLSTLALPILMVTSITAALGIFLRGLFIRFFCNLINLKSGVLSLPENWKETLWGTDFTLSPELLPGAAQVDVNLGVSGIFRRIKEAEGYIEKWLILILTLTLYIPAIIWRWSLKSTLWIWWLLALVLRSPFEGKSLGEVRDIAAIRVHGLGKWLPLLAVVVMLWLSSGYLSPETIKSWAELGGDTTPKLLDELLTIAPPPPGLRYCALWLVCVFSVIMWLLSDRLQIMHRKVLEEEDALDGLTKERQNLFLQRAHCLERWHTARVVSFILLGYSFVLYLANEWYPLKLGQFIPAWLIDWL